MIKQTYKRIQLHQKIKLNQKLRLILIINSKEDTKNEQQDHQSLTEDEITQEPQRIENNGDKNNLKTKTKFDTEKVDLDPNAKDSPYKAKDKVENETATP